MQLEHFFTFVVRNERPPKGGNTALTTSKNQLYFVTLRVIPISIQIPNSNSNKISAKEDNCPKSLTTR
jgi:hypothetical protein